jgi:lipopolysaccharide/colanic/teichoic acid biosynthesis glycosyltransferase
VFKLEDDPRVTRVGRFLRRWSLDELPQLWNVVRGDMSLVGPRPEEEAIVARYDAHHRRRLKAKPGLTGLQQLEARASSDLDERVRLDVYYLRRRTFLFDLWILARTPWAVLRGKGAV